MHYHDFVDVELVYIRHMSLPLERIELQIVHAIAGRVRVKIPRLRRDFSYSDKLQRLVQSLNPVTNVQIHRASASMIVYYNSRSVENQIMQRALAVCVWQANSNEAISIESPLKLLGQTTQPQAPVIEAVPYTVKPIEADVDTTLKAEPTEECVSTVTKAEPTEERVDTVTKQSAQIETPQENLSQIEQFSIHVDLEQRLFEVGIPASYILEPLNAELKKLEAEQQKNTETERLKVELEVLLREGGFLLYGRANGYLRRIFFINPLIGKKYYTPWISMTAVGTAELEATVVDETINLNLTKLSVYGESGKWYTRLVKYAFNYLFKTKLIAKINDTLSKIEGAKIQQLFLKLKADEKLRERTQELGFTPEKVDELLELVEVNARVSSDRLWLSVHL